VFFFVTKSFLTTSKNVMCDKRFLKLKSKKNKSKKLKAKNIGKMRVSKISFLVDLVCLQRDLQVIFTKKD